MLMQVEIFFSWHQIMATSIKMSHFVISPARILASVTTFDSHKALISLKNPVAMERLKKLFTPQESRHWPRLLFLFYTVRDNPGWFVSFLFFEIAKNHPTRLWNAQLLKSFLNQPLSRHSKKNWPMRNNFTVEGEILCVRSVQKQRFLWFLIWFIFTKDYQSCSFFWFFIFFEIIQDNVKKNLTVFFEFW